MQQCSDSTSFKTFLHVNEKLFNTCSVSKNRSDTENFEEFRINIIIVHKIFICINNQLCTHQYTDVSKLYPQIKRKFKEIY